MIASSVLHIYNTHHQNERIIGNDGDECQEEEAESEARLVEGIRDADHSAPHDGINVVKSGLRQRGERISVGSTTASTSTTATTAIADTACPLVLYLL